MHAALEQQPFYGSRLDDGLPAAHHAHAVQIAIGSRAARERYQSGEAQRWIGEILPGTRHFAEHLDAAQRGENDRRVFQLSLVFGNERIPKAIPRAADHANFAEHREGEPTMLVDNPIAVQISFAPDRSSNHVAGLEGEGWLQGDRMGVDQNRRLLRAEREGDGEGDEGRQHVPVPRDQEHEVKAVGEGERFERARSLPNSSARKTSPANLVPMDSAPQPS